MLAAVAGALGRHQDGLVTAGVDQQLLAAAPLQRDEPECCGVDAVSACGEQAVVLVDGSLHALEPVTYRKTCAFFNCHLTSLLANHHMVFEKGRSILGNRLERAPERGKSGAVDRVRMTHRHDIRMRLVNRRVEHEASAVERMRTLHNLALVVGKDEVGNPHLTEVHAHRICPVEFRALGIPHREVPGKAVVESLQRKGAAGGCQTLLAIQALCLGRLELGYLGKDQPRLGWLVDRCGAGLVKHGELLSSVYRRLCTAQGMRRIVPAATLQAAALPFEADAVPCFARNAASVERQSARWVSSSACPRPDSITDSISKPQSRCAARTPSGRCARTRSGGRGRRFRQSEDPSAGSGAGAEGPRPLRCAYSGSPR